MRDRRTDNRDIFEIDLWKMMLAILDRWKLILSAGLGTAVLALLITLQFITPMYRAGITVYVNNSIESETIEFVNASNLAAAQQLVNTYVNMIRSDTVLEKVARSANLEYTAEDIRRMMTASQVDETEIFEVYISHPDPEEAVRIANAIADVAPDEIAYFVEGSSTKIIDYARIPEEPYTPSILRNTLLGGILGGVAAVGLVFLGYVLDTRIKDEEELAIRYGLPVLGRIPNGKEASKTKDAKGGEQE